MKKKASQIRLTGYYANTNRKSLVKTVEMNSGEYLNKNDSNLIVEK